MGANPNSLRTGPLALILVAAGAAILFPGQTVAEPPANIRLVLLGTGNPNPEPEHSGPSVAIVVGEDAYIIVFGPGVVRRATAANRRHNLAALDAEISNLVCLRIFIQIIRPGSPTLFSPLG